MHLFSIVAGEWEDRWETILLRDFFMSEQEFDNLCNKIRIEFISSEKRTEDYVSDSDIADHLIAKLVSDYGFKQASFPKYIVLRYDGEKNEIDYTDMWR